MLFNRVECDLECGTGMTWSEWNDLLLLFSHLVYRSYENKSFIVCIHITSFNSDFFCTDQICIYWWFMLVIISDRCLTVMWMHLCAGKNICEMTRGIKTNKMEALKANICIPFCSVGWPPLLFCCAMGGLRSYATWIKNDTLPWLITTDSQNKLDLKLKVSSNILTLFTWPQIDRTPCWLRGQHSVHVYRQRATNSDLIHVNKSDTYLI